MKKKLWALAVCVNVSALFVCGLVHGGSMTGWTMSSLPSESWSCVASSADGTMMMAADLSGGHHLYLSASSGATWQSYGPAGDWSGVASSADGTKLAAAPWDGPIYTSTNSGVTWSATASPSYSWRSLASSADGTKLAAGGFWEGVFEVSTNSGKTWAASHMTPVSGWVPVAWSADGNVLMTASGNMVSVSTNDGITSRSTTLSGMSFDAVAASADGSKLFAASGSEAIYVSTNFGVNWTLLDAPAQPWTSIACSADGFRVVAASSGYGYLGNGVYGNFGNIFISHDGGIVWTNVSPALPPAWPPGVGFQWSSIACSSDGSQLIAANDNYFNGPVYTGFFPTGPRIVFEPQSHTNVLGAATSFKATATGTMPLHYQWKFNGVELANQTNALLQLASVQFTNEGNYQIIVTNSFGVATGSVASLVIVAPMSIATTIQTNIDLQTGLFYQQVRVQNDSLGTITGLRFIVTNLVSIAVTNSVYLVSATGTNANGQPYEDYSGSLAPGSTNLFTLAYYSKFRQAPVAAGVLVEVTDALPPTNSLGTTVIIRQPYMRPDGKRAFEFSTLLNRTYVIQYSNDLVTWKQAQNPVTGTGTTVIWVDTGPPDLEADASGSRYYRVVLLSQ